jgi:hypothetical protein
MYKFIIISLLFASFANAQTKSATTSKNPSQKNKPAKAVADTLQKDTVVAAKEVEVKIPREFKVYTQKPKQKKDRTKLCINLVCADTVLNYCMNDSICRDPEVSKILFEEKRGDTTFVLVYVDAFSKPSEENPQCNSGKETKLFFVKWNTKTNQAKWKQRTVSSCMKGVTNMTKEPISNWDKSAPLVVNYYKGGSDFIEIKFDPLQPQLGFQSTSDGGESK